MPPKKTAVERQSSSKNISASGGNKSSKHLPSASEGRNPTLVSPSKDDMILNSGGANITNPYAKKPKLDDKESTSFKTPDVSAFLKFGDPAAGGNMTKRKKKKPGNSFTMKVATIAGWGFALVFDHKWCAKKLGDLLALMVFENLKDPAVKIKDWDEKQQRNMSRNPSSKEISLVQACEKIGLLPRSYDLWIDGHKVLQKTNKDIQQNGYAERVFLWKYSNADLRLKKELMESALENIFNNIPTLDDYIKHSVTEESLNWKNNAHLSDVMTEADCKKVFYVEHLDGDKMNSTLSYEAYKQTLHCIFRPGTWSYDLAEEMFATDPKYVLTPDAWRAMVLEMGHALCNPPFNYSKEEIESVLNK